MVQNEEHDVKQIASEIVDRWLIDGQIPEEKLHLIFKEENVCKARDRIEKELRDLLKVAGKKPK